LGTLQGGDPGSPKEEVEKNDGGLGINMVGPPKSSFFQMGKKKYLFAFLKG